MNSAAVTPGSVASDLSLALERLVSLLRRLPTAPSTPPLSLTSASTLRLLDQEGPRRLSELAVREGVTQPAMTQLVTRLERDGLATRSTHPDDARVVLVGVTPAGSALVARRRATRAVHLQALIDALPATDREHIAAALPALVRLADAHTG